MKKVLLIEDNAVLLKAIETYLRGLEFEVVCCKNTCGILEELDEINPDLGIFDVWVDPVQGDHLSKAIKQNNKSNKFPIILISAKDNLDATAKEALADDHLHKPFHLPELGKMALRLTNNH